MLVPTRVGRVRVRRHAAWRSGGHGIGAVCTPKRFLSFSSSVSLEVLARRHACSDPRASPPRKHATVAFTPQERLSAGISPSCSFSNLIRYASWLFRPACRRRSEPARLHLDCASSAPSHHGSTQQWPLLHRNDYLQGSLSEPARRADSDRRRPRGPEQP
jgi:hypothetical protein